MKENYEDNEKKVTEVKLEAPVTYSDLLRDLTKSKDEGNALYKEKKIEEARLKFKEGYDKFERDYPKLNKDSSNNKENKEILLLAKKILSNLALCFYIQEKYIEAIEYDMKLLQSYPKFAKSLVRLFNSYSKLNKIQQAVYYGELFLELDQETRDKYKGIQKKVKEVQLKLKEIQKKEKDKIKKDFGKYVFPLVILCIAVLGYLLSRKNEH